MGQEGNSIIVRAMGGRSYNNIWLNPDIEPSKQIISDFRDRLQNMGWPR